MSGTWHGMGKHPMIGYVCQLLFSRILNSDKLKIHQTPFQHKDIRSISPDNHGMKGNFDIIQISF